VGIEATVEHVDGLPGLYRSHRVLRARPKVSIVVPTMGKTGSVWGATMPFVCNMADSVLRVSSYRELELVIVADAITPLAVRHTIQRLCQRHEIPLNWVPYDKPFNFSDKINIGAVHSSGDVLVLLNDDIEVISPDWLEWMLAIALEPDVGLVGPKLLYSDSRVQSAGHSHRGGPFNIGAGLPRNEPGPFWTFSAQREVTGLTAACAVVRREVFMEMGGLCTELPRCFNDVDFSLKLLAAGYRLIWTPWVELYHFESMTRDPIPEAWELEVLKRRWAHTLMRDRYTTV
jgi:hypothetical protein